MDGVNFTRKKWPLDRNSQPWYHAERTPKPLPTFLFGARTHTHTQATRLHIHARTNKAKEIKMNEGEKEAGNEIRRGPDAVRVVCVRRDSATSDRRKS